MVLRQFFMPVVALIIAGSVVAGAAFVAKTAPDVRAPVVVVREQILAAQVDPDGDGLVTWQETLWGTDPENPDTDGDGISDGDETAGGGNPTEKGEDAGDESYRAPAALAPTEALARELFSSYAAIRRDGVIAPEEQDAAITALINARTLERDATPELTIRDITVGAVPIEAYENALTRALGKAQQVREYELNTFARAVQTGSRNDLVRLTSAGAVYETIYTDIAALTVPDALVGEHLATVNALALLAASVEGLAAWSGDPLEALALIEQFSKDEDAFGEALQKLYAEIRVAQKV